MFTDEQPRTERMDGCPSLLHAAAGLVASDRNTCLRCSRAVQRKGKDAEACRLRANREAAAALSARPSGIRRTAATA